MSSSSIPFGFTTTAAEVVANLNLDGKVVIVTGGNTGIGLETARALVRAGARVIIAARNAAKAKLACEDIGGDRVESMALDLSSFASIRQFAADFVAKGYPLHVLVANAFPAGDSFLPTADGFETLYGASQLGHFLLIALLLDTLRASAPSRIVIVGSAGAIFGDKDSVAAFPITDPSQWSNKHIYFNTKLANGVFATELARRLQKRGEKIHVTTAHPGSVMTQLATQLFPDINEFWIQHNVREKTTAQGAATLVYNAVHPDIDSHQSGLYYEDCQIAQTHSLVDDEAFAVEEWKKWERLVGVKLLSE